MRPIEFEILLSLAMGVQHGYAIIQDIESRRDGADSVHTGTLYRAIERLVDDGLVALSEPPRDTVVDDERRRYYAITPAGRKAAAAEAKRMASLVAGARAARLIPGGAL